MPPEGAYLEFPILASLRMRVYVSDPPRQFSSPGPASEVQPRSLKSNTLVDPAGSARCALLPSGIGIQSRVDHDSVDEVIYPGAILLDATLRRRDWFFC